MAQEQRFDAEGQMEEQEALESARQKLEDEKQADSNSAASEITHSSEKQNAPSISEEKWHTPLLHAGYALIELVAHTIVVCAVLGAFHVIELVLRSLNQADRVLFKKWPLSYVFDAADLAILTGFLAIGVYAVLRAYTKKR